MDPMDNMDNLQNSALLIIDLQNDFVRAGAPMEVEDARTTLPKVRQLIQATRKKNMPIIYTKFLSGPCQTLLWTWSPQIKEFNACRRGFKRSYADLEGVRFCADIVDEIYPEPNDYIVEKYGYSAFKNTNLKDILLSEGITSLIVVGTVTQICVADTVHDAFSLGFRVLVVSDLVTSFMSDLQDAFLKNFSMKFGWVKGSDEVLKMIEEKS
jgi:nicotinamidase-related amidase